MSRECDNSTTYVVFKVNNRQFKIGIPASEDELFQKLLHDDSYAIKYLDMLSTETSVSFGGPITDIIRINGNTETSILTGIKSPNLSVKGKSPPFDNVKVRNDTDDGGYKENNPESELDIVEIAGKATKQTKALWTDRESNFLMDQYQKYVTQVGPMEKFRTKKLMWTRISTDLLTGSLHVARDAAQCENRYKTCLKRKTISVDNNAQSSDTTPDEIPIEGQSADVVASNANWTDGETKFLLDQYSKYVIQVGPLKKFKTKKVIWNRISSDLLVGTLGVTRDATQCENRYKTCLKWKKASVDNNRQSGNTRHEIPFEEEFARIAANDDSIEPEVLCSAKKTRYLKKPIHEEKPKTRNKSIQEFAQELHNQKEESKERRHKEKLELIAKLFQKQED